MRPFLMRSVAREGQRRQAQNAVEKAFPISGIYAMARSRNIKPGFFTNDELCALPMVDRLLFAGLWVIADRDGRVEDRPRKIRAEVMPYDEFDADKALNELAQAGFIARYEAGGARVIQVLAWGKHQNPHIKEAPSVLLEQCKHQTSTVQSQVSARPLPERAGLIPSLLIPDSLSLDSSPLIPDSMVAPTALSGKAPRKRGPKPAPASAQAWESYANRYQARYGAAPVRNASVNAQMAQVVGKLGADEAPLVAAFFVGHQNGLYVSAMHPVNLLLRDAEKLRTEWATGRTVTRTQGQQADRTQSNLSAFAPLLAAAEAREAAERAAHE